MYKMILWKAKEEKSEDPTTYCDAWRSVLEIGWFYILWTKQYKPRDLQKWNSSHTGGFGLWISSRFLLGEEHVYYDGEHCSFGFGFLKIMWTKFNCKKCMPDNEG